MYYQDTVPGPFDQLYREKRLPQVFVCANDIMALAVYHKAQEYGFRIPEDIAVTGFDGVPYSQFITPPLATCHTYCDDMLPTVEKVTGGLSGGSLTPGRYYSPCRTIAGGSCGCRAQNSSLSNEAIIHTFRDIERTSFYEEHSYNIIEKAIDFDCQSNIYEEIRSIRARQDNDIYQRNTEDSKCAHDREELIARYSCWFGSFVLEMTEGNEASEEEVNLIKTMGSDEVRFPVAIDDYGSGFSNIVNLLRYAPQIIKVDRYLITDIDRDANKQMFMKGTLEFAEANNIRSPLKTSFE